MFLEKLEVEEQNEHADRSQMYQLYVHCKNYEKILSAFIFANEVKEKMEIDDQVEKMVIDEESQENTPENLDEMQDPEVNKGKEKFILSEHEITTIKKIISLASANRLQQERTPKNVTFEEKEECLVPFLASFHVCTPHISINDEIQNVYETIGNTLFQNFWNQKKDINDLLELFKISEIPCEDVMKSFLYFWQQRDLNFEENDEILKEMEMFKGILKVIMEYAGDKTVYAYNSICEFWQCVREYLLETEKSMNALMAAIICKDQALLSQTVGDEVSTSFEQVSQEEAQWSLLIGKLDDVAVLTIFICSATLLNAENSLLKIKYEIPKVTLKKIINGGKGVISELVANWIIGTNIDVALLFVAESETIKDDISESDKTILQKLCILKQHFPFSLNSSVLLCYIIWNLMCRWSKTLSDFVHLREAMKYLALIPENAAQLKHGLCCLIWNAHFKIPLKATKKLINKTGRLPKEKLCFQDIGVSDTLVPEFLEITVFFMDQFMGSVNYPKVQMKFEEILQESTASLVELVLQQNRANLDLLKLHYEMFLALELISFFNIKYPKPVQSLFDEIANESFFCEVNKASPYKLTKADEIRQNTRIAFLCKAINASIDLIYDDLQSVYFKDHSMWIEKIKKLGNIWGLNEELLARQQVRQKFH
jgi:hypothetical protein